MLSQRNPATGIISENKRTLEICRNRKKFHISYCEEKVVGLVRRSSHTAASLM